METTEVKKGWWAGDYIVSLLPGKSAGTHKIVYNNREVRYFQCVRPCGTVVALGYGEVRSAMPDEIKEYDLRAKGTPDTCVKPEPKPEPVQKAGPLDVQIGGDHYKKYAIQPIDYIMQNRLDVCQGNIVKYVTRFRDKGGIEDLKKAQHYLEILIEFESKTL